MTATRPDPVAPAIDLEELARWFHANTHYEKKDDWPTCADCRENAQEWITALREDGYVLLNADMLAEALRRSGTWTDLPGLETAEEIAAAILAALEGQS
jgi:hypothetical protein